MIDLTNIKIDELPELCFRNQERWFPENNDGSRDLLWYVLHFGLGVGGEGGEVTEAVKKLHRMTDDELEEKEPWIALDEKLAEELADVMAYVFDMCAVRMLKPSEILARSMEKCEARWAAKSPDAAMDPRWVVHQDGGAEIPISSNPKCVCGKMFMSGAAGVEVGGVYHRADGPCFVGDPLDIMDFINGADTETRNCTCGKYQFTGISEEVRDGVRHSTAAQCRKEPSR